MRPTQIIVTSGNSPLVVPVDSRSGESGIVTASPAGGGNYTVQWTADNIQDPDITPTYIDVTDMVTSTTVAGKAFSTGVTALKVTLHSGTSVAISISQP